MHLSHSDQLVRVKLCWPKHSRWNIIVPIHQSQTITTQSCNTKFISISTVIISRWQLPSTDDSYYQLSPLQSIKPKRFYQPTRPLLSICRKLCLWAHSYRIRPVGGAPNKGRIRLSVSTVNRTYELSGIAHVTPFPEYVKHSTGSSTYGPWVRTYSKLFSC